MTPSADTPLIIAPLCAPVMTLPTIAIIASSFTPLGPSKEFNHTHVTQGEGSGSFKDCQRTNGKGINLRGKSLHQIPNMSPTRNGATCFSPQNVNLLISESEIPIGIVSQV